LRRGRLRLLRLRHLRGGRHRARRDRRRGLHRRRACHRKLGLGPRPHAGADVALDHRQAVDHALQRVVHGLERVMGAAIARRMIELELGQVALERLDLASAGSLAGLGHDRTRHALGGHDRLGARLGDLMHQLADGALDRP
jgi:hypothetical protein